MTGLKVPSASDSEDALAISRAFGGLPLALTQVGGFIAQRKMALHEFLPLYEKYSSKIDCRKTPGSDYEYTLGTVWDVSFGKLPEESTRLLSVLSFLDPDGIPEDILSEGSKGLGDDFAFLADEMEYVHSRLVTHFDTDIASLCSFGDASEELLRAALVDRSGDTAVLAVHRLVQSAARKRLSESDSVKMFDAVVHMLCWGFPDHSKADIGHQVSSWTRGEKCLPHVNNLVDLCEKYNLKAGDRQKYADLLLRCGW